MTPQSSMYIEWGTRDNIPKFDAEPFIQKRKDNLP